MRAESPRRTISAAEPLRLLPIVFISLLAVMLAVDAMIALQPALLAPLRDSFQHWVGAGWIAPSWASVFATGVAVAAIAIAASVLSVVIRGVQAAPFVWLAPIVVGSGALLMARLPAELPVPFSAPGFALLAAGALLGGGALLRADSFSMRFTGALVLGLPLILLSIGYSQGAASHGATEFLLVLVLSTVVIAALGYATRERAPGDSRGQGEQLLELLERARTAEARATFAEQQLASAGYGSFAVQSPRLLSDDDELARMRGGGSGKGLLWVAIMFLTGSLAAGYLAGYVPLQNRLDAQRRTAEAKGEHNTRAMTALRSRFDTERSALQAQLRAAQAAQADAVAAAAKVSAAAAGQPLGDKAEPAAKQKPVDAKRPEAKTAESQAPEKAKVSAPTVDARAGSTHATRPARKTKVSARAAAVKSAAGKPAAAAEAHYDDEALDDDPIGGL